MSSLEYSHKAGQPKRRKRGIVCPDCGSTKWKIVLTHGIANEIVRQRNCLRCPLKIRTRESFFARCNKGQKPNNSTNREEMATSCATSDHRDCQPIGIDDRNG